MPELAYKYCIDIIPLRLPSVYWSQNTTCTYDKTKHAMVLPPVNDGIFCYSFDSLFCVVMIVTCLLQDVGIIRKLLKIKICSLVDGRALKKIYFRYYFATGRLCTIFTFFHKGVQIFIYNICTCIKLGIRACNGEFQTKLNTFRSISVNTIETIHFAHVLWLQMNSV